MSAMFQRRWYQFSLLSLFMAMSVIAIPAARIGYLHSRARFHEREGLKYFTVTLMLAPLNDRGLKCLEEGERHLRMEERYRSAMWYPWLLVDEQTDIGEFTFPDHTISDDDLSYVASRLQLVELDLSGTQVTDAGIAQLSRLRNLSHLRLKNTRVTDEGVRHLQEALPKVIIHR